jgi:alpha-L-fucosidase 2
MQWRNNHLLSAKINSTIGGNLRVRSYVPLKGKGLKLANGENTNPLFKSITGKQPIISSEITPKQPQLKKVYEYDIATKAGEVYMLTPE